MATVSANADGTHKIQQIMTSLKKQKKRIEELEDLLKLAKEKYAQLKRELAVFQVEANPTYISRLPTEILAMIFKLFLCDNETHIRRLLLVCKRWYHLVMGSSDMWTVIRIEFPRKCWDVSSWAESIGPFVVSCVERSHANLLDISLDLSELCCDGEQVLFGRLRSALEADYDVDRWLESPNGEENTLIDYEFEPVCFDDDILSLLEDLTGPNGELMVRWGSFELHFPREDDLALQIWERVVYPTPNLTTLRLFGLRHLDNRETLPHAFADLSHLENFYIEDVAHWDFLSLSPSSLRHIRVRTHIENRPALQLSRFRNLKSLEILCEDVNWSELPSDAGPTRITLPQLEELTLVAPFEHLTKSDFNLPSLKYLFLVCSYKDSPKQLPSLRPIFVVWHPSQRSGDGRNSARMESILRDFLCHFTTAEDLAVPVSQKLALLGLVTRMSAGGPFPHSWDTVSFHSEEEIVETVVIDELLKHR